MGYLTKYSLTADEESSLPENWAENISNGYLFYFSKDNYVSEEAKWYHHEVDCQNFSLKYPNALFTLKGRGEEEDDIWVKYFKNGKMQREEAEIVFPPFDESRLRILE